MGMFMNGMPGGLKDMVGLMRLAHLRFALGLRMDLDILTSRSTILGVLHRDGLIASVAGILLVAGVSIRKLVEARRDASIHSSVSVKELWYQCV